MGNIYEAHAVIKQALGYDSQTPAYLASLIEVLEHPIMTDLLKAPLSGPFNGQVLRQAMFREVIELIPPETIFETGTFHGTTTDFMAQISTAHIFTCEIHAGSFRYSLQRFHANPDVTVLNLDSRSFLRQYVPQFASRKSSLFYLDAHWDEEDLPLLEELQIVFEHAPRAVILIDDFQVWDDPGYGFDDYGPTRRLTLDYLAPLAPFGPRYFFPLSSAEETNSLRGCVALTIDPEVADRLAQVSRLRPAPPPPSA
ncbi:MAG: hypothetical protein WDO24_14400 [Pseudomonadota bacterium]